MVRRTARRTAATIRVMVGRFGSEPETFIVRRGSTVGDVLAKAEIAVSGIDRIWLNGEQVNLRAKVAAGDLISVISPKEAGL